MKSFNSSSLSDSQSNIVPFNATNSLRLRRSKLEAPRIGFWNRIWDHLFDWIVPTSQPKITQVQKKDGNEYYEVYDPATGHSKTFGSELETRIWLDRRFYENSRNW
jgi:hypothetical protein